jgi:hypothetical protein
MLIDYDLKLGGPCMAGSRLFFDFPMPLHFRIAFVLL